MAAKAKAVLFDCDGVLINSEELCFAVEKELFERHGLFYDAAFHIETFTGRSHGAMLARVGEDYLALTGKPLPADFSEQLLRLYDERVRANVRAIEGVAELLSDLKRAGIPFAVASNSSRDSLHRKLHSCGLHHFFDPLIFSCDDVANPKPAPDMFLLAAAALGGFRPEECVVIEDSITGATAGLRAGMHVIGFTEGAHRPHSYPAAMLRAGLAETAPTMAKVRERIFALAGLPAPRPQLPPRRPSGPRP
jgi:HAD superfamily hydrolase (TIGR01509 family)